MSTHPSILSAAPLRPISRIFAFTVLMAAGAQALAAQTSATAQAVGEAAHPQHDSAIQQGAITINGVFARATLPGAPVAGGFLQLTNTGEHDDRLLAVQSGFAARNEIHEMAMQDGVMKMRALPDGLPLPAGETVTLEPGGLHLMFMDLTAPLTQGTPVAITLQFEQAGEVTVPMQVGAPNARAAAGHGDKADMSHMEHGN